ncbi:DNA-processing protein DprA [Streptomyces griseoaurantiacus]|uniref:DNA-processing protein DprA n=1 Tax=Streptomyces griseoaurantiacus TaxID=68213 RepID=UPI00386A6BB9
MIGNLPPFLFYRGELDARDARSIAVVGTRQAPEDGLRRAARMAREFVEHDVVIASGLAKRIDAAAHQALLAAGGRTFAVTGTARLCPDCAGRTLQPVADSHCLVRSQTTLPGKSCANRLCARPVDQQGVSRVDAVAVHSGALRDKIHKLKYDGTYGWVMIFGRLLVGWTESHPEWMRGIDHVVGNPTHTGRQPLQHIEAIMDAACTEDVTAPSRSALRARTAWSKGARRPGPQTGTWTTNGRPRPHTLPPSPGPATQATSRGPRSCSSTTSSPAGRNSSRSHSGSGPPAPPTSADSSLRPSPGADDPAPSHHAQARGRGITFPSGDDSAHPTNPCRDA